MELPEWMLDDKKWDFANPPTTWPDLTWGWIVWFVKETQYTPKEKEQLQTQLELFHFRIATMMQRETGWN